MIKNLTNFEHTGRKWEYEYGKDYKHRLIKTIYSTHPIGDNVELEYFGATSTVAHTILVLKNQLAVTQHSVTDALKTFRRWIISMMSPGNETDLSWANELPDNYQLNIITFNFDPGLEGHDEDEEKVGLRLNTGEIFSETNTPLLSDYLKNELFLKQFLLHPEEVYKKTTLPKEVVDYINLTLSHTTLQRNTIKKIKGWLSFLLKKKHTIVINDGLLDNPDMKYNINVTWFYDGQHLPPLYYTWEPLQKHNAKIYGVWKGDYEEKPEGTFVLQVNKEEYEPFLLFYDIESLDKKIIQKCKLLLDKIFKKVNIDARFDKDVDDYGRKEFRIEII
jgi:hypothetical protein